MHSSFKYALAFFIMCGFAPNALPTTSEESNNSLAQAVSPYAHLEIEIYESQKDQSTVTFTVILKDSTTGCQLGSIIFEYNAGSKKGFINRLHIFPNARKKSYGSILLQFALDSLTECDCQQVNWVASPFDLQKGQTQTDMLPKLIAFYEKHGAKMLSKTAYNAQMIFNPKKVSREEPKNNA